MIDAMELRLFVASLVVLAVILAADSLFADEYQDGYQAGYGDAQCDYQTNCSPPVAPVASVPPAGQDSRDDGYRAGIEQGADDE